MKRTAAEMECVYADGVVDGRTEVPNQVFLGKLPPKITAKRLEAALKHCGKIERINLACDETAEGRPCKGYGWVTFSTSQEAQAACELDGMLECGSTRISICISCPRPRTDGKAPHRRKEIQILIEPHKDCWFCLANPKVEKHMVVVVSPEVYVAVARGPIVPMHVLILPVKHAPCYAACPPELQASLDAYVVACRKMCHSRELECLVWERWIPMSASAANHMQIQVLAIDQKYAWHARDALETVTKRELAGASFKSVDSHAAVTGEMGDDASTPYLYFELPGDNTSKGRRIERYVYAAGREGGPRIPVNFGRQVACHLLSCEDKVDWREYQEDKDTEKGLAMSFRQKFRDFQPKSS